VKKILFIAFLFLTPYFLLSQQIPAESNINPAFKEYLEKRDAGSWKTVTEEGYGLGLIPLPVKPHFLESRTYTERELPSSYDLRDYNLVTSVKNQGGCGSCWAFATMGAIESHWLVNGYGSMDLSEQNLRTCHGYEYEPCNGGNMYMSGSYLSRMAGPVTEADDPYNELGNAECNDALSPVTYIPQSRFLPPDAGVLKQAIMDHGGLYTSFYWNAAYYNSSDYTYYYNGSPTSNHAVLLVGWDDNKATAAELDGAWIMKNSWGDTWGENGYCYISYYDASINSSNAVFPEKIDYNSDNEIYFYDEIGLCSYGGFGYATSYGLVKFVATGHQDITKVGTWAGYEGTKIEIEIYDTKTNDVLSDLLGSISEQTCVYPGYYTFDLPAPILVTRDNDFYIKVRYTVPGGKEKAYYPLPVEVKITGFSNPSIESGVYWRSITGSSWTGLGGPGQTKWNLCIHAYTEKKPLVWTGTDNNNWSNTGNWSPQFVPASDDDIVISAGADYYPETISGDDPVIRHFTVNPGAWFTLPSGKSITVQGDMRIRSDASATAMYIDNGTLTVNGKSTVERYTDMQKWHYISPPLSNATSNMITGQGQNLYFYNETSQQWSSAGTGDPLIVMKGYNIYLPWSDITEIFTGEINTGSKSIEVTANGNGWNLVGNPYPSAIDWDASSGWTKTNINDAIYIWNEDIENWATYIDGSSANGGSQYIAPGQGFWILATGTGTLGTTNDVRVINDQSFLKDNNRQDNKLKLKVSDNTYSDETVIRFNNSATNNFDGGYDALKKFTNTYVPQVFTLSSDSVEMTINTFPAPTEDITLPLHFIVDHSGSFTITAEGQENFSGIQAIYLEDTKENQIINLNDTPEYTFAYSSGEAPDRFLVRFTTIITEENIIQQDQEDDILIYSSGNMICLESTAQNIISGEVRVYDLPGREIIYRKPAPATLIKLQLDKPAGYYIVSIITTEGVYTEKVLITAN